MFELLSTIKPEVFVQGGSVVVALYLVWSQRQKDKEFTKLVGNHLDHDQESRDRLSSTLQKLTDTINKIRVFRGERGTTGKQGEQGEQGVKGKIK